MCERASYMFERAPSWAKGALFVPDGRPNWYDSRHICLEGPDTGVKCTFLCFCRQGGGRMYLGLGAIMGKECAFSCEKGAFAGGRGAVSALNGAIMSRKGALSARGAPSLAEGAPHLL